MNWNMRNKFKNWIFNLFNKQIMNCIPENYKRRIEVPVDTFIWEVIRSEVSYDCFDKNFTDREQSEAIENAKYLILEETKSFINVSVRKSSFSPHITVVSAELYVGKKRI